MFGRVHAGAPIRLASVANRQGRFLRKPSHLMRSRLRTECGVNATFLGRLQQICRDSPRVNSSRVKQLGRTCREAMFNVQAVARIAVLSALSVHCACSIFPTSGPASSDVRSEKLDPEGLPYALVRITPEVENVLERKAPRIAQVFPDRGAHGEIRFGIGDVLSVTVFEAAAGGLFTPLEAGVRPGNFITLPNQAVDNNGNITVPLS